MPMSFVDAFWTNNPDDFVSTSGFDIVWKRMKCSQKMGKDIEEYLKSLARIENAYSKNLIRLNKSTEINEDLGNIGHAWNEFKLHMDQIAATHEEVSSLINSQVDKIKILNDTQDEKKRKCKESVRKYQAQKLTLYQRTINGEKMYKQKLLESIQCRKQYESSKSTSLAARDTDKLHNRYLKAEQSKESADVVYKSLIDQLKDIHNQWEMEMQQAYIVFQSEEEERIHFQRNLLWVVCNAGSQACVADDNNYENVRKSLEQCDVQKDIADFININQTGKVRPACPKYHSLEEKQTPLSARQPEPLPANSHFSHPFPNPLDISSDGIYSTLNQ